MGNVLGKPAFYYTWTAVRAGFDRTTRALIDFTQLKDPSRCFALRSL